MEKAWKKFIAFYEKKDSSPILIPILKKASFSGFSDDEIFIACENLGTKILLETKKNTLKKELSFFLGKPVNLNFFIKEKDKKKTKNDIPLLKFEKNKQEKIKKSGLSEKFTFENFAVSSSNQFAHAAALAVAKKPGDSYNPLFVYGDVGVGKTHLIQAIANKILEEDLSKRVLFCSSEDFVNDLVEFIRIKNASSFRKKYRSLDVLLVDDIQFIAGKNAVQEEFFHTFNSIIRAGGQIILTSDRPPQEIKRLEDRLRSRFSGGLAADIQKPDPELRAAILLIKAKERNIEINLEVASLLAEKIKDTRELEGKLLQMYARSLRENKKISKELVEEELSKKTEKIKQKVSPQDIIRVVCSYYNLKISQIKDSTRKERITLPRQIIMFILRNTLKLKYEEIAYILKRKDHTTILHGVDKVTSLILKNPVFKDEVNQIVDSLSLST
jgi:chromosomal replication initiator protein